MSRRDCPVIDNRSFSPVYEMTGMRRTLLAPVAYPLSALYRAGVWLWRRRGVRPLDAGVPVISVGSISVGGTGKTPLSMMIAEGLKDRGMRVAVVSRGYKRKRGSVPLLVSDGRRLLAGVEEAGDEPYMMARRLPGVAVLIDSDRVRGVVAARDELSPDVVLLDDGLQCRRLLKRLDIVTLGSDALRPGAGYLPWGPLREGFSAVGPGDFVVCVARSAEERERMDEACLPGPGRTGGERARPESPGGCGPRFFFASYVRPVIVDESGVTAGEAAPLGRALLVSGIARPEAFEETCRRMGIEAGAVMRYDDHHWYSERDAAAIERVMKERDCAWVATTEKDLCRFPAALRARVRAVRIDLRVEDAGFLSRVEERLRSHD